MKIRLSEKLASGARYVVPVLLRRLASLKKDPAGAHTLSALGATVSIEIRVGEPVGDPADGVQIGLQALKGAAAFPVFQGTLRVETIDTLSSQLVLAGTYNVPLGAIGTVADRTVLAGVAKRSLRALLADIRTEVAATELRSVAGG